MLAVDYVSKWVEAKPTRTDDSKVVADFIKSHIFSRFGIPRALISNRGTHFCNKTIEALLKKNIMSLINCQLQANPRLIGKLRNLIEK